MSNELVAWLREQLDEDERVARACHYQEWTHDGGSIYSGHPTNEIVDWVYDEAGWDHIARWDPAQVLREVEAKRASLEETIRPYFGTDSPAERNAWLALRLLAWPYADRPGYREEWKP